jgi:uncharacterized protein (TIGR02646 family)
MRYIKKGEAPKFFNDEVSTLKSWDEVSSEFKRELTKHILENEQNSLCGYCEAKIRDVAKTHLEHVVAKHKDLEKFTFDYSNIIVSCDGICFQEQQGFTCGHRKDTKGFKPDKRFLNPTKTDNIRKYFKYTPAGLIGASTFGKDRATHTLKVLNLDSPNNYLPEERKKSLQRFQKSVKEKSEKSGKSKQFIIKHLLSKENFAFISFLRFMYKDILNE